MRRSWLVLLLVVGCSSASPDGGVDAAVLVDAAVFVRTCTDAEEATQHLDCPGECPTRIACDPSLGTCTVASVCPRVMIAYCAQEQLWLRWIDCVDAGHGSPPDAAVFDAP